MFSREEASVVGAELIAMRDLKGEYRDRVLTTTSVRLS